MTSLRQRLAVFLAIVCIPCALFAQLTAITARAATASPLVRGAYAYLLVQARGIDSPYLRAQTLDVISNPNSCIIHRRGLDVSAERRILDALERDSLIHPRDSTSTYSGVFPAVRDADTDCPKPLQSFEVSAGGNGGHHDYPGGLPIHTAYNLRSAMQLIALNEAMYLDPMGVVPAPRLKRDIVRAAVIWHDWAKTLVLQWRPDGTLTPEIEIAGTGAHHILGVAEAMARNLPVTEILAQVSSHAAPGLRDNPRIVRWIRAAAAIARVDPVARGYLMRNASGDYLLVPARGAENDPVDHVTSIPFSAFPEAAIVNVSDENLYSIAATGQVDLILAQVAPQFGYAVGDTATYRTRFRNPVLSYVGADRLAALYRDGGNGAVVRELERLRRRAVFQRPRN